MWLALSTRCSAVKQTKFLCHRFGSSTIHLDWQCHRPRKELPCATPLLLIHGFGCGQHDWGVLPRIIAAKSRREVISFDNRGIGGSATPDGAYTVKDMAEDARSVMDAAGIEKAHILGISLGGMVAQAFAWEHPDRTSSLVLGCTMQGSSGAGPTPEFLGLCESWAETVQPNDEIAIVERFVNSMLPKEVIEKPGGPQLISQFRAAFLKTQRTGLGLRGQLAAMGSCEITDKQLNALACPVLVITGDLDKVVPMTNSLSLARQIPGATLRVWDGAGHFWWAVRTAEAAGVVSEFLLSCDKAQPGTG